jgi:hypothetical protein
MDAEKNEIFHPFGHLSFHFQEMEGKNQHYVNISSHDICKSDRIAI